MVNAVIRPVRMADLDTLLKLAAGAGPGMTNFPSDKTLLSKKIELSIASFAEKKVLDTPAFYFFVLEELSTHEVKGCSAILSKAGGAHPFYSYKVAQERLVSTALNITNEIEVLYLLHDYHDVSEICSLYLSPDARGKGWGALLTRMRFLFVANFPKRFSNKMIAEMRGVIDDRGYSPFWEGLGRHFFSMDFTTADQLTAEGAKQFIVDIMPRCPIYTNLLPESARAVIGKVHTDTLPDLKLLEKEGFHYEGYIDIFDAGATIEARTETIYSVRKSIVAPVADLELELSQKTDDAIIVNTQLDCRACLTALQLTSDNKVVLPSATASVLQVQPGDTVRFVKL